MQVMQLADIPWDEVAFPTTRWALDAWQAQQGSIGFQGAPVRNPGMGVP